MRQTVCIASLESPLERYNNIECDKLFRRRARKTHCQHLAKWLRVFHQTMNIKTRTLFSCRLVSSLINTNLIMFIIKHKKNERGAYIWSACTTKATSASRNIWLLWERLALNNTFSSSSFLLSTESQVRPPSRSKSHSVIYVSKHSPFIVIIQCWANENVS